MNQLDKAVSEEPAIEPQVQEPTSIGELGKGTVSLSSETATTSSSSTTTTTTTSHTYSTRSKERSKEEELERKSKEKQRKHNVVIHPRLKPVPFKGSDILIQTSSLPNEVITIDNIKFYQSEDHPFNKRGFKYKPCRPNPEFPSNLYATTDISPHKVCISIFDRSNGILYDQNLEAIAAQEGWRSARTNIGIREGKFYFEFKIINANEKSHVRIGIGRREASLEAPVGFDGYGYGIRDVNGEFMTISRRQDFIIEGGFTSGDVIGFLVELPSLEKQREALDKFVNERLEKSIKVESKENSKKKRKINREKLQESLSENEKFNDHGNILRDQIPIRYKNALYYEQYEYTSTKTMEHLLNPITVFGETAVLESDDKTKDIPIIPNSRVRIFKNGKEQPTAITNLFSFLPTNLEESGDLNIDPNLKQSQNPKYRNTDDGSLGYYPMLSAFQEGAVALNPGPDFQFGLPNESGVKPLSDRFEETAVEEWYWDILDEVEAQYLDSFEI
ncbi:ASH2 [[Candida] subhashii]|uniref:ASH2 n=1 Tax=[Candida] subhashii TaxID=561895 RepID=A0A8J5QH34_9ASCO|nr:ASH2 [[Candida] subhashii]KAG7660908.1 ASH2 [[Candida] subhashii]